MARSRLVALALVLSLGGCLIWAQSGDQPYDNLVPIPGNEDVSSQSPYSSFSNLPQENYGTTYPPNGSYPYYNPYPTPYYPYSGYSGSYYNNFYNARNPGYPQNYRPEYQGGQGYNRGPRR